jgi:chromosome segregation ATPase
LCVFGSFPLFASGQSLADAARKERERQKEAHSKVNITATGVATTTTATSSGTAAVAGNPFEPKDNYGHNEKYWRERFDKARAELKSAEDQVQLLDTKVKGMNTQLLTRSDIYNRENTLGPEITAAQKQLDDANAKVDQTKQKISDLEEELRKAGGPAGWAR